MSPSDNIVALNTPESMLQVLAQDIKRLRTNAYETFEFNQSVCSVLANLVHACFQYSWTINSEGDYQFRA